MGNKKKSTRYPTKNLIKIIPSVLHFGQYLAVMALAGMVIYKGIDNVEAWVFVFASLAAITPKENISALLATLDRKR